MASMKRWIATGTAAAVATVSAVALVGPASAASTWVDAGTLQLTTVAGSATGQVSYVPGAGGSYAPTAPPQALTASATSLNKCDLASTGSDLLRFSGRAGAVAKNPGLAGGSIGVNEKLKELCARVDTLSSTGPETLELALGAGLTGFAGKLWATAASLDLELRNSGFPFYTKARATITAYAGTAAVGAPMEVGQGLGGCSTTNEANCQVSVNPGGARFDRLVLQVTKGSFSLEGGSDTGAQPTTFTLTAEVDQTVTCVPGTGFTEGNTTVTYVGSVEGECSQFGAVLTSGPKEVRLLKPLDTNEGAQFIVDIAWEPTADPPSPEALTQVFADFEVPGGQPATQLGFCPDVLYVDGVLTPIAEGDTAALAQLDDWEGIDGTQFACIGHRTSDSSPFASSVTDKIYLIGDVRFSKP